MLRFVVGREAELESELDEPKTKAGTVWPPHEDVLGGEYPVHCPH